MSAKESEKITRKKRIDKKLKALGWEIIYYQPGMNTAEFGCHAVEEYPTSNGPADYALFVDGRLLGIVEAKKFSIGTQNVIEQAKRYAKGVVHLIGKWGDYMVPFLYSTNGEKVYYYDTREQRSITRELSDFHTPQALKEQFGRNVPESYQWLHDNPVDNPKLRPYQKTAIEKTEEAIINSKRKMMVAMATGTGKTFMAINLIYRLIKSKTAKRILFLVDRRSLAAQSVRSFAAFETPHKNKFDKEYEIYSQQFKREDLEDEKYQPTVLPNSYLTAPDESKTFIYISTIQRMAINLYGPHGQFQSNLGDDESEPDADKLDIPIHAFDIIIADECHRGYTSAETNVWRSVLNHFDAIKVGLTATPAAHTVAYFGEPVFKYPVERAIKDGWLVDYDAVKVNSNVLMNGAFLREGEQVGVIDTRSGSEFIDQLEDERAFSASEIEAKITAPDTIRKVVREIKKYTDQFESEFGRMPKTLIFAVNDIEHISHCDRVVHECKEEYNQGDDFVAKVTSSPSVDRPLKKIREFRNRPEPKIVVTVDMLSTGVDIPALEYIIFLRPVKSRILWEQMLGRGTRLCPDINKTHFTIFDCFNGTLIEYFKDASNFKVEPPRATPISIAEIIDNIWENTDRDYNITRLQKRLKRIEKNMSPEARLKFSKYIPDGDMAKFADDIDDKIIRDFTKTMELLRDKDFQHLLENYPRARKQFFIGYEVEDEVTSNVVFEVGEKYLKPKEYLEVFSEFVKENRNKIEAFRIIHEKPANWNYGVLKELKKLLEQSDFKEKDLQKAHGIIYHKELADIISMIKHAIDENEPVLDVTERVEDAFSRITGKRKLTPEQQKWMDYIKEHVIQNLSIELEDFDYAPVFERHGGKAVFKKLFKDDAEKLIEEINKYIAA